MRVHAGLVGFDTVAGTELCIDGLNTEQVGAVRRTEQEAPAAIGRQVRQTLRQGCLTQRLEVPGCRFYAETQHLIRLGTQCREQGLAVRRNGHRVDLITGLGLFDQAERPALLIQAILGDEPICGAGNISEGRCLHRQTERTSNCSGQQQNFSHGEPFYCCGVNPWDESCDVNGVTSSGVNTDVISHPMTIFR